MSIDVYDRPGNGGNDYILQVKIRNGPLLRAMRMRGYRTPIAFAEANGISVTSIYKYLAIKLPARTKTGRWAPTVEAMARALHLPPEALFPVEHIDRPLKKNNIEVSCNAEDLLMLTAPAEIADPETQMIQEQQRHKLHDLLLTTLRPREYRMVADRYGLHNGHELTYEELGKKYNLSKDRVRQIEQGALRRLKGSEGRRRKILTFADGRWFHGGDRPLRHYVPYWKRRKSDPEPEPDEVKTERPAPKAEAKRQLPPKLPFFRALNLPFGAETKCFHCVPYNGRHTPDYWRPNMTDYCW